MAISLVRTGFGAALLGLVVYLVACGFGWLLTGSLFPLLCVVVWYPLLLGAALTFLAGLVRNHPPTPASTPQA